MSDVTRPEPDPGLCATCTHSQQVETPRARYWLCRLSRTDSRFAKYPRLPVWDCDGYQPVREER